MKKCLIITALLQWNMLLAGTFEYKPTGSEPGFSFDIPDTWQRYSNYDETKGQILFYNGQKERNVFLEIRSSNLSEATTTRELMHQLTARLSMRFFFVELLEEKAAAFRPEIYTARWKISDQNKTFIAKTAILHQGTSLLVVVAIAPQAIYARNSVYFENAILSLKFLPSEGNTK